MLQSVIDLARMVPAPVVFFLGVALLLGGGHALVEGSVRIARRFGVSTLLIGLTVVAFGTSAPELAFNLATGLRGSVDLCFGNVVGSNIANIGLVLAIAALACPLEVHSRVPRRELPAVIGVSLAMTFLAWLPWTRPGAAPGFARLDGVVLLAALAVATWIWYRTARSDQTDPLPSAARTEAAAEGGPRSPLAVGAILAVAGILALAAGGGLTEIGAVGIATALGLSPVVIGLSVVALATSLPELVTSVIAARRGHADLAIGNVLGSNQFNVLLALGATCTATPVPIPDPVRRGWIDLAVMLAFTAVLIPVLRTGGRIVRGEGALLLLAYLAYMAWRVGTGRR